MQRLPILAVSAPPPSALLFLLPLELHGPWKRWARAGLVLLGTLASPYAGTMPSSEASQAPAPLPASSLPVHWPLKQACFFNRSGRFCPVLFLLVFFVP